MARVLLSPASILMVVFLGVPVVYALVLSLFQYDLRFSREATFAWFSNYQELVTQEAFRVSSGVTLRFGVVVIVTAVSLSLAFALALRRKFAGGGIMRVVLLLPWAVAPVIAGTMWKHLFHQQYGLANALLYEIGAIDEYVPFFAQANSALIIAGLGTAWRWIPLFTIVLLAGVQAIPESLYRAARMDGAGPWRQFTDVTLPAIRGLFVIVLLLSLIVAMESFDLIFSMTGGGPGFATSPLNYLTYIEAFERLNFGSGSALGVIVAAIVIFISFAGSGASRLGSVMRRRSA